MGHKSLETAMKYLYAESLSVPSPLENSWVPILIGFALIEFKRSLKAKATARAPQLTKSAFPHSLQLFRHFQYRVNHLEQNDSRRILHWETVALMLEIKTFCRFPDLASNLIWQGLKQLDPFPTPNPSIIQIISQTNIETLRYQRPDHSLEICPFNARQVTFPLSPLPQSRDLIQASFHRFTSDEVIEV